MAFGSTPQEPLTSAGGKAREIAKAGGQRVWRWLTAPWTWSASQTASFVDQGPVGQQLRNLDGRAQVHGAAIEIMSAQVNDIARDQAQIMKLLDRPAGDVAGEPVHGPRDGRAVHLSSLARV